MARGLIDNAIWICADLRASWRYLLAFTVLFIVVMFAWSALAETNRERGMLNMDQAFGPKPAIRLCEVKENGAVRLRACPKKQTKQTR